MPLTLPAICVRMNSRDAAAMVHAVLVPLQCLHLHVIPYLSDDSAVKEARILEMQHFEPPVRVRIMQDFAGYEYFESYTAYKAIFVMIQSCFFFKSLFRCFSDY
jgi:hypothetical protein